MIIRPWLVDTTFDSHVRGQRCEQRFSGTMMGYARIRTSHCSGRSSKKWSLRHLVFLSHRRGALFGLVAPRIT